MFSQLVNVFSFNQSLNSDIFANLLPFPTYLSLSSLYLCICPSGACNSLLTFSNALTLSALSSPGLSGNILCIIPATLCIISLLSSPKLPSTPVNCFPRSPAALRNNSKEATGPVLIPPCFSIAAKPVSILSTRSTTLFALFQPVVISSAVIPTVFFRWLSNISPLGFLIVIEPCVIPVFSVGIFHAIISCTSPMLSIAPPSSIRLSIRSFNFLAFLASPNIL